MDPTGQSLLDLLFNKGESICVSDNEFGTHSIPLEDTLNEVVTLTSPNEKTGTFSCYSSDLTMVALNPINGWRRDEFVTSYRSFLVELDIGDRATQLGTIEHLKMPFSAQIWSGGKSVHTTIVLDEDLPTEKMYRMVANWIFSIVPLVDKACQNPSRSIRIPGAYRAPGKKQELIEIRKRVTQKELFDWLKKYEHLRPKVREKKVVTAGQADYVLLAPWCRAMLREGIVFKNGRNQTWYAIAYEFTLAGFSEEQIVEDLSRYFDEESDFKEKEFLTTIASAFKHATEGKG